MDISLTTLTEISKSYSAITCTYNQALTLKRCGLAQSTIFRWTIFKPIFFGGNDEAQALCMEENWLGNHVSDGFINESHSAAAYTIQELLMAVPAEHVGGLALCIGDMFSEYADVAGPSVAFYDLPGLTCAFADAVIGYFTQQNLAQSIAQTDV